MVNDPLVLTKISELYGRELWTGQGIFTQLSPWIEINGKLVQWNIYKITYQRIKIEKYIQLVTEQRINFK